MISRKALNFGQKLASFSGVASARLARAFNVCKVERVKAHRICVPQRWPTFQNPSPWRQSGVKLHLLPPFFTARAAAIGTKREILCPILQKSSQSSRCRHLLPVACSQIRKSRTLQAARLLAQLPPQLLAETKVRSSLVPSLVQRLAHLFLNNTPTFSASGDLTAFADYHPCGRRVPLKGRAAFCV